MNGNLFETKARAPRRPFFNAYEAVAKRKLGAPPGWEWYALDGRTYQHTGDTIVEGGVPARTASGRKTWKGVVGQKCVVTELEVAAMRAEYEQATGKCVECAGCGEELAGSSTVTGPRYRTCRKCGGSGRAPNAIQGPTDAGVADGTLPNNETLNIPARV